MLFLLRYPSKICCLYSASDFKAITPSVGCSFYFWRMYTFSLMLTFPPNFLILATLIPKTSGQPRRTPVPWWTKECRDAIRARERAYKKFDRRSTTENLIAFRKARAFARRTIKEAKAVSWRNYVTSLSRFTPLTEVWTWIKRISGLCSSSPLPVLRVNDSDVTHPSEVA